MKKRTRIICATIAAALLIGGGLYGYRLYVRKVLANFKTVVEGQVYRSAQPTAAHLKAWKERYGIRSVINLRGEGTRDHDEEARMTSELGLKLVDLEWSARRIPGPQGVRSLTAALDGVERPVLIHCAAGIDRSGVAGAIAAMYVGNVDYETARREISSRSVRDGDGVAALFSKYEEHCRQENRTTGGWPQFREWLDLLPK